jgi:hypothetical protein
MRKLVMTVMTALLFAGAVNAQTYYTTLTFTANMADDSYIALDSVQVTNVTNNWTETLYGNDTTLTMSYTVIGITEADNRSFAVGQNIPNPFNGSTLVPVRFAAEEQINMALYDLSGKQCAVYNGVLAGGDYAFAVSVASAQMYLLQITSSQGTQQIKMLCTKSGGHFSITPHTGEAVQTHKAETSNLFSPGTSFSYTGYCTYNGEVKKQTLTASKNGNDETISFTMQIGYAVGDVYYDGTGNAEGVIWWLADTVAIIAGVPYGQHGRMISLDEANRLLYAVIHTGYPTNAHDSVDGRVNTAIHLALASDTSTYYPDTLYRSRLESVLWCTAKGEGWYFPAKLEMEALCDIKPILNTTLQAIGGEKLKNQPLEDPYYQTSTEDAPNRIHYVEFVNCVKYVTSISDKRRVRAMKWF